VIRTDLVLCVFLAATAVAAVRPEPSPVVPLPSPQPGSSHFKIVVPLTTLQGGTATISVTGPPPGLEIFQATWTVAYLTPHGGTPASDLVLELSLPLEGGGPPMVVTGADLGWPAAAGAFSGSFTSSAVAGVLSGGPNTTAQVVIHSTEGGVVGAVKASIVLEMEEICQEDLGFAGPGHMQLSVCGDLLAKGGHAELNLTGAPPSAPLLFLASLNGGPKPFKGGAIAPVPRMLAVYTKADAAGSKHFMIPGGGVHALFFLQVAAADPSQTYGAVLSNALAIELFP
jgi:hypothetical protein